MELKLGNKMNSLIIALELNDSENITITIVEVMILVTMNAIRIVDM